MQSYIYSKHVFDEGEAWVQYKFTDMALQSMKPWSYESNNDFILFIACPQNVYDAKIANTSHVTRIGISYSNIQDHVVANKKIQYESCDLYWQVLWIQAHIDRI